MLSLTAGIFLASLLGSLHCAGMCGAFVAIAVHGMPGDAIAGASAARLQLAYHAGRFLSYSLLGAAAGSMGQLLDLAGAMAGVRPIAAAAAGATLIAFGIVALLRVYGLTLARLGFPGPVRALIQAAHRKAMDRPPVTRALAIGLLTTLLPCGWLYAFAVTAAGTASAWRGAAAMAVFWAGTLPILVTLGAGARALTGSLGRKLPLLTAIALIVLGSATLLGRSRLDPEAIARRVAQAAKHSTTLPATHHPCCTPDEH